MTDLLDALYVYAAENRVTRFQWESAAETRTAQRRADKLTQQLNGFAPEAGECVEKLKEAWDEANDSHTRAVFLAGLSIGLELGRLCSSSF